MSPPKVELLYACPASGLICTRRIAVHDRRVTIRRWTNGSVKATVCTIECAESWATNHGYIATGVSETHGPQKKCVVIAQHPDQVNLRHQG